jgi:hypothetical protein
MTAFGFVQMGRFESLFFLKKSSAQSCAGLPISKKLSSELACSALPRVGLAMGCGNQTKLT